jgi:hypothetical protein
MPKKIPRSPKLGPIVEQPDGKSSAFKTRRRMPGWHSDAEVDDSNSNDHKRGPELFLEEAIERNATHFVPFETPQVENKNPFDEPQPGDTDGQWLKFNQWMLGKRLEEPASGQDRQLFQLLERLSRLARNYNAALYRLRRLHYYKYSGNKPGHDPMPPRNPHGETDDPNPGDNAEFQRQVEEAECDWRKCTHAIDTELDQQVSGMTVIADMIEVNQYIVSMRVVLQKPEASGEHRTQQVGGSSSHVSISSPFSSSRP